MTLRRISVVTLGLAFFVAAPGCAPKPDAAAAATPVPAEEKRPAETSPVGFSYPPPVQGRHAEANTGNFDLVDGLAYTAKGGEGTVVYATSKSIASPVLASSPCPMTDARALTSLRDAGYVEVTLDEKGKSKYFVEGTAFGGTGREEDVADGRYWKSSLVVESGVAKGEVRHASNGFFEFTLPVLAPRVTEVSESDRIGGKRSDPLGITPAEGQVVAAYQRIRAAALKKDLAAVLAAQGFDPKQIEAIRGLPGIDADFAVYADRFLEPGTTGEFQSAPGYGAITGEGVNSKGEKFTNFYWFTPCRERLVLTNIYENAQ